MSSYRARRDSRVPLSESRHDEDFAEHASESIFDGPISQSIPTSQTGFAHNTSFSAQRLQSDAAQELLAVQQFRSDYDEELEGRSMLSFDEAISDIESSADTESVASSRRTSVSTADGTPNPLFRRHSQESGLSGSGQRRHGRTSQKVYLQDEDLFIIIAGFRDDRIRSILYHVFCLLTLGLGYLMLRWLPRWQIRLTGVQCPLASCEWVVIENQWHEVSTHRVGSVPFEAYLSTLFDSGSETEMPEEADPFIELARFVDYRYIRFVWHEGVQRFMIYNNYKDRRWRGTIRDCRRGLDEAVKDQRLSIFGQNVVDVQAKRLGQLLVDEALHPFYIFQIASILLWSFDEYYYYATCIFVISIATVASTVIETRSTMLRLREMARFTCEIRALRNGYWQICGSEDLVPGDIIEVSDPSISTLPCDALLLAGECIVNESMLTGESVPVPKTAAGDKALHRLANSAVAISPELAKHYLFAGTRLIQVKRPLATEEDDGIALAMCTRTAFNTTKGALVRSMLFPKPTGFKFYRDSFRFIGVMALVAMCGFIVSAVNFVRLGLPLVAILVRALDLITIVVPPALPATLTIGTSFSISRMRRKQIFCIAPTRVNVAGKINVMCFDKTGTLTEDGLDVLGVRTIYSNAFVPIAEACEALPVADENRLSIIRVMATCHSLRMIDDDLLGDPLDDKMFRFSGWSYEESNDRAFETQRMVSPGNPKESGRKHRSAIGRSGAGGISPAVVRSGRDKTLEIGIIKQYDFVSSLRRMSVITKQFGSSDMEVYLKGAPEIMREVCRPESFPADYEDVLATYTHDGYRVIACAGRKIPGLSWIKAQKLKRAQAEKDLDFLGFIVFENKLKSSTPDALRSLNDANIRTIMCTGDNVLTAVSVARESSLIPEHVFVFGPKFGEAGGPRNPLQRIVWQTMEGPQIQLDPVTMLPSADPHSIDLQSPFERSALQDYRLAITGEVFRWMVDFAPKSTLERMLIKTSVFARMSPDEKQELVERLQELDYCVGFCGDGANDCGALKAADVGISLSEAEASVAAPFTSRVFEISCVVDVIREGRAALVTSFSCFKYMALYSAIQFTTVSILYLKASNLGDFQFLLIDLALILPIAIFMGRSKPFERLALRPPTANLVSKKVMSSLLGHVVVIVSLQLLVYFIVQGRTWYIPPDNNVDEPNIESTDNTVLFLLSLFQYCLVAVVFSVGPPYRQPMHRNLLFVATITIALSFSAFLTLSPGKGLSSVLQLTKLPLTFRVGLILVAVANLIISILGESHFVRLARIMLTTFRQASGVNKKKRKAWKVITEDMRM
ncbi:hypothetical protein PYCC9005_004251 [Savitreella phatthalungensis]